MDSDKKELLVREIRTDSAGRRFVIGVANNGETIRLGDVFVVRYERPQTVEDIIDEEPVPDPINPIDINLTVAGIEWPMRRHTEELPGGHTGAMYLTGNGIEHVTDMCFLRT